jgi:hypothetical protein
LTQSGHAVCVANVRLFPDPSANVPSPVSTDFHFNVARKPAVGGLFALGEEFDFSQSAVPKISAHL